MLSSVHRLLVPTAFSPWVQALVIAYSSPCTSHAMPKDWLMDYEEEMTVGLTEGHRQFKQSASSKRDKEENPSASGSICHVLFLSFFLS